MFELFGFFFQRGNLRRSCGKFAPNFIHTLFVIFQHVFTAIVLYLESPPLIFTFSCKLEQFWAGAGAAAGVGAGAVAATVVDYQKNELASTVTVWQ